MLLTFTTQLENVCKAQNEIVLVGGGSPVSITSSETLCLHLLGDTYTNKKIITNSFAFNASDGVCFLLNHEEAKHSSKNIYYKNFAMNSTFACGTKSLSEWILSYFYSYDLFAPNKIKAIEARFLFKTVFLYWMESSSCSIYEFIVFNNLL